MDELFKGRHFRSRNNRPLRALASVSYKLSFRDLVEMMAERGLFFLSAHDDHVLDSTPCARIR